MPKFSQRSFSQLASCHIELQTLFYEVIRTVDCKILEGFRNESDQNKAFEEGKTELRWPSGRHNLSPSMAVDAAPYPVNWENTKRFFWFGGYVLGIAHRLKSEGKMTFSVRWGGDWDGDHDFDDQSLNDLVHFELI